MKILSFLARIFSFFFLQTPIGFSQAHFLYWPDLEDFATFGANSTVIIDLGKMDFVNNCQPGIGINDFVYPWTDIYIIQTSSLQIGDSLKDVSGSPNTVVGASDGAFVGETVGFTKPGGTIDNGMYSVVYDECQNGIFDAEDGFFPNAFEVVGISTDVPEINENYQSILDTKLASRDLGVYWLSLCIYTKMVFEFADLYKYYSLAKHFMHDALTRYYSYYVASTKGIAKGGIDPKEAATNHLLNMAKHYNGIYQDPPDSNFLQLTYLDSIEVTVPQSDDLLLRKFAELGANGNVQEIILFALLKSMERYKGAEIKNDAKWALIHARSLKMYAGLLKDQLSVINSSLSRFNVPIQNNNLSFDSLMQSHEEFRVRLQTSGFTTKELEKAACLGLSPSQLAAFGDSMLAMDLSRFNKDSLLQTIATIQTENATFKTVLDSLMSDMDKIINYLKDDPQTIDNLPVANAGGSYAGTEGSVISFDGSQSTSAAEIVLYEWDFDGDGQFDDGTGSNPSYTYSKAFTGLVGVKVTDQHGFSNVNYSAIEITNTNNPPHVLGFSPAQIGVVMDADTSHSFSIIALDPDGDDVTIEWYLDSILVSNGTNLIYSPTLSSVGSHVVYAKVSDNNPLGGSVVLTWITLVLSPDTDADGDGFSICKKDCNDANASIYPDAIETCNGIDDNCDGQIDEGAICCPIPGRLYVDAAATGLNTGQTWTNAFTDLSRAIELACKCPSIPEIWVAKGTYKPAVKHGGQSERHKTFFIDCDLKIYGGFLGTETILSERNWQTNLTILSGEAGVTNADTDNCYHVIWIDHVSSDMRLDGIRITGGNADGPWQFIPWPAEKGGGIYNDGSLSGSSNPTIANCTFYRNGAHGNGSGGGMFNYGYNGGTASPTLINCLFSENSGGWGGAMYNFGNAGNASPVLNNCTFAGNFTGYNRYGGAIINHSTGIGGVCNPNITDCKFIGNWANSNNAGAVYNVSEGGTTNPVFTNCTFLRNAVFNGGEGGAVVNESGFNGTNGIVAPVFSNCIFSGNYADLQGGAIRNARGNGSGVCNPTFLNCSFSGNKADHGIGTIWNSVSSFVLTNCILWGNSSGISNMNGGQATVTYSIEQGGFPGTGNLNQDPKFNQQPDFNDPLNATQDLRLQSTSVAIDAGNDGANSTTIDLEGNPRKVDAVPGGSKIDQGAYEYQGAAVTCYADAGQGHVICEGSSTVLTALAAGGTAPYKFVWSSGATTATFTANPSISTIYTVTITDDAGCEASDMAEITVIGGCPPNTNGNGLVLYLPMNSNAIDVSGNGNNGTLHGNISAANDRHNQSGAALSFDGNEDYISIPNSASLQSPSSELTLAAWVKYIAFPQTYAGFVTKSDQSINAAMYCMTISPNWLDFQINNWNNVVNIPYSFAPNTWYFVAATFTAGTIKLFANGSLIGMGTVGSNTAIPDTRPLIIGRNSPGVMENFQGTIDEIRLYNRALSESEIANLYLLCTQDSDNDGYPCDVDCNDADAAIHPGASEVCDGIDNNCNNLTDINDPALADNIPPSLVCPTDRTVNLGSTCSISLADYRSSAQASDNCTYSMVQNPAAGTGISGTGVSTITLIATDTRSNTRNCNFTVTRIDTTVLVLKCSANIVATNDLDKCNAVVIVPAPVVIDNCATLLGNTLILTNNFNQTNNASDTYPVGTTSVLWTVTDAFAKTTTCVQFINVQDTRPPNLTCPGIQELSLNGICQAILPDFSGLADWNDDCGTAQITQFPSAGTLFDGLGTSLVTLTVQDLAANSNSCSLTVTRTDDTPPNVNCPSDRVLLLNGGCTAILPDYRSLAITTDNCPVTITQAPESGVMVNSIGSEIVTFTVTDMSENIAKCSFAVKKQDSIPLGIVTCPANREVVLDGNCRLIVPNLFPDIVVTNNCTATRGLSYAQSPDAGVALSVANGLPHTVNITVTDILGNSAHCLVTLFARDQPAQTLTCPSDLTLSCETSTGPSITGVPNTLGNCDLVQAPTFSDFKVTDSCAGNFIITRTWSVSDILGNTHRCNQVINVQDVTSPVISCPQNISVICDIDPTGSTGTATALDNCDPNPGVTYLDNMVIGDCTLLCTIERTWEATDNCGNTKTCLQAITRGNLSMMETALSPDGITLGYSNSTLNILPGMGNCILQWLPSSDSLPTSLKFGNQVVDTNCKPGTNPLIGNKLKNPLLAEALKLNIFVRLKPSLGTTELSKFTCNSDWIVIHHLGTKDVNELLRVTNLTLGNISNPIFAELLSVLKCINGTVDLCK